MLDLQLSKESLPAVGIVGQLSEEIRAELFARGQVSELNPGEILAVQGKHHGKLSVILSGALEVKGHARGDTVTLAKLSPGDTVGEMSAIDPKKASANVEAVKPTTYWWISMEAYRQFLGEDWERAFAVLLVLSKELCHRIRMNTETMLRMQEQSREASFDSDF